MVLYIKEVHKLQQNYAADLDIDRLVQLAMLPDVGTANRDHKLGIRKVTSINTVCELFNTCTRFSKTMHCDVD